MLWRSTGPVEKAQFVQLLGDQNKLLFMGILENHIERGKEECVLVNSYSIGCHGLQVQK